MAKPDAEEDEDDRGGDRATMRLRADENDDGDDGGKAGAPLQALPTSPSPSPSPSPSSSSSLSAALSSSSSSLPPRPYLASIINIM